MKIVKAIVGDEDAVYVQQLLRDRRAGLRRNPARTLTGALRQTEELNRIQRILDALTIEDAGC